MIPEKIIEYGFPDMEVSYQERDVILYALGVNVGQDPMNERELKYLFEEELQALPPYAMVLGHPGFWLRDPALEVDWVKLLHAEQFLSVSRPLPAKGTVLVRHNVLGITDKGEGRGAIVYYEKLLRDAETKEELCRVTTGVFCRGDGGCGDYGEAPPKLAMMPEQSPDISITKKTDLRSALIYRLSGDYNPLHIMPDIARQAGYDRPILHGLCSMGIAGLVLQETVGESTPSLFGGYACRFSKPVFPGDILRVDIWVGDMGVRFRVVAEDRNEVVLDRGHFSLRAH
ncbi:MaoC/PaaZ C-terminal domain-containing protein [Sneathiella sp.]|uniref:MaoC/PaaZ C-terminal domain-containing protein n=1 Tax=Sneathiella sp. TaxID=1964365 RepID=UPI0026102F93|nr:MaoC/PaaZ C-terminal domain-containing protein [Sneathiella sp.]MDF2368475.1 MaoC/PaaZ C-terminal domain-containing protein [Sneathiella sp.]